MPMMLTEEDLSLRHLPETSDYSFSFQIPTSITQSDDLLAENGKDFFKGANYSSILSTPAPTVEPTLETASLMRNHPTPRSSVLGPSLSHRNMQNCRNDVASTSDPCNRAEVQASSIVEQRTSAPKSEPLGNDPQLKRIRKVPRIRLDPSSPSTNMVKQPSVDVPSSKSSKPTFGGRSPVGSHLEVSEHLSDLPRTQSHVQIMHADTSKENQEREEYKATKSKGLRRTSVQKIPQDLSLKDISRFGALTKHSNGTVGLDGTLKSRTPKGPASSAHTRSKRTTSGMINGSSVLKQQLMLPEEPDDGSAGIDDLQFGRKSTSIVSGGGATERLMLYGQQLMNTEENIIGNPSVRTQRTEGYSESSLLEHMELETAVGLEEHRSDPSSGYKSSTTAIINEDVNKPLTVSQLSPRKRRTILVVPIENNDSFTPPALDHPPPSDKKRRLTFASAECPDQRPHKKGRGSENAISEEFPSILKDIPTPIISFPSEEPFSNPTTMDSSPVISETVPSNSGSGINESSASEKQGGRTTQSKSKNISITTSLSTSTEHKADRRSGTNRPKKTAKGIGTRLRRLSKTSSSVSGGRTLRPRSVSTSAAVRVDILDASVRERQVARLRTRRNAQGKGKGGRSKSPNTAAGSRPAGLAVGERKNRPVTRSMGLARVDENKNTSDDCIEPDKRGEERMSRSASSLSHSSSSNSNHGDRRLGPLLHSASNSLQGSERAYRKENIRPVIPQPFQWATEERMKERRKFDEMVKEKEREKEASMEEKRKERELEEERELRELRRKMVPKANAVPEWYKNVPKKKKEDGTVGLGSR